MILSRNKKYFLIFSLFFFLSFFGRAEAATLYLSPSSGTYDVGNIINTSILVNTQGSVINNADAVINFPSTLLEVVSLSKSGSIFSLWVEEPSFSNSTGRITFNGGVPTPGYSGTAGKLLNVTFRIRSHGTASVVFSSGSVRANDGYGTDIIKTLGTASFTLKTPVVLPPPAPDPKPEPKPIPKPAEEPKVEESEIAETPVQVAETEVVEPEVNFGFYTQLYEYTVSLLLRPLTGILFIILLLLFLILYGRRRFILLRKEVKKDTYDIEKKVHLAFDVLKDDVVACVDFLEKAKSRRHLTEEERTVVYLLKKHLRDTEKLVSKELHDIRERSNN